MEPQVISEIFKSGKEMEVLVKWKGLPEFQAAGEVSCFHLEDKLEFVAGSNGERPLHYVSEKNEGK